MIEHHCMAAQAAVLINRVCQNLWQLSWSFSQHIQQQLVLMKHVTSPTQQQELEHFNQLSSHWWDPNGAFAALHQINPLRLAFIDRHTPLSEQTVVDIGCGGGILSEAMAKQGAQVLGIDLAKDALQAAKEHADESLSLHYQHQDVHTLAAEQAATFSVVTCMEMLEHVDDPEAIVQSAAALAKPGGHVFFSTLNRNAKSWLLGIVAAEYLLNMVPKGTHQHKKFIRPGELSRMARQAGLIPVDRAGIVYNLINQQFSLHPTDLDVNYLLAFKRTL